MTRREVQVLLTARPSVRENAGITRAGKSGVDRIVMEEPVANVVSVL